ncbi:hypothetical protein ACQJBY_062877 [Aegilops geniculata]
MGRAFDRSIDEASAAHHARERRQRQQADSPPAALQLGTVEPRHHVPRRREFTLSGSTSTITEHRSRASNISLSSLHTRMCVVGPGAPRVRACVYIYAAHRCHRVAGVPSLITVCPRRGATCAMELELGLAPPNHAGSCGKRATKEAFGIDKGTLPLLRRDNDDGDHGSGDPRRWEMGNN